MLGPNVVPGRRSRDVHPPRRLERSAGPGVATVEHGAVVGDGVDDGEHRVVAAAVDPQRRTHRVLGCGLASFVDEQPAEALRSESAGDAVEGRERGRHHRDEEEQCPPGVGDGVRAEFARLGPGDHVVCAVQVLPHLFRDVREELAVEGQRRSGFRCSSVSTHPTRAQHPTIWSGFRPPKVRSIE